MRAFKPSPLRRGRRDALPPFMLPIAFCLTLFLAPGPNLLLVFTTVVVLVLGAYLTWRPGEPPILILIFAHQWLQIALTPIYGNVTGVPINKIYYTGGDQYMSVLLSLGGLTALALGIRIAAGRVRPRTQNLLLQSIHDIPQSKIFLLYVTIAALSAASLILARSIPALAQIFLALSVYKWAGITLVTYATFSRKDGNLLLWAAVFFMELLLSFGGYFSSFKFVFIFSLIGLGAAQVRLKPQVVLVGLLVFLLLLLLGAAWTAIKVEYRLFLSGGLSSQAVVVSFEAALSRLVALFSELQGSDLTFAFDEMARRIMYTQYFGIVLERVPAVLPHEGGAIWLDALSRPVMPRFLFPEKAAIDESMFTNIYTGLNVAGSDRGTQISIGYMADTYIDFGAEGMLLMLFAVGYALGRIYRWILYDHRGPGVMRFAIVSVALLPALAYETSSPKLVGGLFAQAVAFWLIGAFVAPTVFRWLRLEKFSRVAATRNAPGLRNFQ